MQSRKTLLFNNSEPWVRKSGDEELDVPMNCFDGTKVCNLIGVSFLNLLKTVMRNEGTLLYRDDRLGTIRTSLSPEIKR